MLKIHPQASFTGNSSQTPANFAQFSRGCSFYSWLTLGSTRTFKGGRGGRWKPLPSEVLISCNFSWKGDLLFDAKTFRRCSFTLPENCDLSTVCTWFLTLPWQPHVYMQDCQMLTVLFYFLSKLQNLFYMPLAFWLNFVTISIIFWFLRRLWNPKPKIGSIEWRI